MVEPASASSLFTPFLAEGSDLFISRLAVPILWTSASASGFAHRVFPSEVNS